MAHPDVARVHAWLKDHEQELLNDFRSLLRIPSLEADSLPLAPFGAENRRALDFCLDLGRKWGMETKDIEGYCGFAEFGSGKPLVVSLGHLDVVPTGPGWKFPEFGAEISEGYVYARGAVDDKGPTIASFYAMKAIQAVLGDCGVRMRQVFGCNEESGFACVHRYMETEEPPTYGVAPDSAWPLCHGEKGIADIVISVPLFKGGLSIESVRGGQRPNIVIDDVEATFTIAPESLELVKAKLSDSWDKNVTFELKGNTLTVKSKGKAAHGSTPFMGDSAATRMFRFLLHISPLDVQARYSELLEMTHPAGAGIGIDGRDEETGSLTSNIGIVWTEGGNLNLMMNVRYPATWKGETVLERAKKYAEKLETKPVVTMERDSAPLYFPLDSPLVSTIVDVYQEETGDPKQPITMGGGTYARAIPHTVSIGTCWLGDGGAHETDERYKIEHLYRASRIYAHIFLRLADIAKEKA